MSVRGKEWLLKNSDPNKSSFQKVRENREENDSEELIFHDPFLFEDMEKAVKRINEAIYNKERIIIFGDYDVDGITSTAILVHTLNKLKATVSYRLPNRVKDGYGLSQKFIDEFEEKNIGLVITVDCGISCAKEVQSAKEKSIDVIITDHHRIPENAPDSAYAIIHPQLESSNYPYKELTGAGVALKLAQALIQRLVPSEEGEEFLLDLFDLASMGTVADLGPITGENKYIVKHGLKRMRNTAWPGLQKLREVSGVHEKDPVATHIGFQLAPRINSAGRIGDPYIALSLLLQNENGEKADLLSRELESLNKNRQEMTESATCAADERISQLDETPSIIMEHSPDWHVGILGLIASKLSDKFARPAIILQDRGDFLTASARSPEFFNVADALSALGHHLEVYGGHPGAAGFTIKKENYPQFAEEMQQYAADKLAKTDAKSILHIDCEISEDELNLEFLEQLETLAPFGIGNERPRFLLRSFQPHFPKLIGKKSDHLKFAIEVNRNLQNVIAFRFGEHHAAIQNSSSIDLVVELERNIWNGRESLSLQALDFKINA